MIAGVRFAHTLLFDGVAQRSQWRWAGRRSVVGRHGPQWCVPTLAPATSPSPATADSTPLRRARTLPRRAGGERSHRRLLVMRVLLHLMMMMMMMI